MILVWFSTIIQLYLSGVITMTAPILGFLFPNKIKQIFNMMSIIS